jgi:hypothetical protein
MSKLGLDLSKVLFEHEPMLLVCDLEASVRAAAEVSNLLGYIMATMLVKYPEGYDAVFQAVIKKVRESAQEIANKAVTDNPNVTPH